MEKIDNSSLLKQCENDKLPLIDDKDFVLNLYLDFGEYYYLAITF